MENKKFYVSTPIYYSNGKPHIGSAYTSVAADVLARWYRIKGFKVYFQTGVDEHGLKMTKAAIAAGFNDVQSFCNRQAEIWNKAWQSLNISFDFFIRTTDKKHETFVTEFLEKLKERGEIYKGKYKGLYCVDCEEYKEPTDLLDGRCPLHNSLPIKIEEVNYFFKLSKYQQQLIEIIKTDKLKVEPKERKNEILGFLENEPLKDISISRKKVSWGIRIPWDKSQTVYCWVDALLNYLSGGKQYWPCDLHLIGKDILRFHTVLWPALLLAGGYPLPKRVYAHGFFTMQGAKMSKTTGNIVYIEDMVKKYKADALRYYLLKTIPFGRDGDFSEQSLKERYNADLANNLGNLVQRVSALLVKCVDGDLEKVEAASKDLKMFGLTDAWQKIDAALEKLQFSEALSAIWQLIELANRYIEQKKPWVESAEQRKTLGNLVEVIREIFGMLLPFMPETAQKGLEQFKGPKIKISKPLFLKK